MTHASLYIYCVMYRIDYTYKIDLELYYTYKMDTLPNDMIFEIVSHLHGDEMVKFSMVNKQMYSMFENERKKLYDTVKQRAIKFNQMMFDLVAMHVSYYNEYGVELLDDIEDIQIRCLSCFRRINLVDHYEHQLCDECMNGVNV
jgi:hypothetical protein